MIAWDHGICWHLEQVTPPEEEPVALTFVRDKHLRLLSVTTEDDYIRHLIKVTRHEGERFTRRAWMPQVWKMVLSGFPHCGHVFIERPPLQTIDSITYIDADGAEQTLDPDVYQYVNPQGPTASRGHLALAYGQVWPTTRCNTLAAVEITFTCGYLDAASPPQPNVPEDLTQGMLLAIAEFYKQRSESVIGNGATVNAAYRTARNLWSGYRVF